MQFIKLYARMSGQIIKRKDDTDGNNGLDKEDNRHNNADGKRS